jgi:hypothetical protein
MKIISACWPVRITVNNFCGMKYTVNNETLSYETEGATQWGDEKVLLHHAIDLTEGISAKKEGFMIEKLFSAESYRNFAIGIHELIRHQWKKAGIDIAGNFNLDQYHTVARDTTTHLAAIENTKLLSVEMFPGGVSVLEERISEVCKTPLKALNPFDGQSIFHFRVVRPNSRDNNPLHRDIWLEDYESCINLYIPVAGSNAYSSLIIIPESHHWPESRIERTIQGAVVNGVKYNVPAVTAIQGPYKVVRPDPKENEVLIFSPYLIHGGAVNLNSDRTRISIEIRLWKK